MSKMVEVDQLLHRAHLFITEGQEEEALATLSKISSEHPQDKLEIAYLNAWCYTLRGRWDEAARFLLFTENPTVDYAELQSAAQTERRRRAYYLLLLGNIAVNLGRYEEATRHYMQCIKFLDERRMNIANVRIKARCGLGTAYTQTGFYTVALTHYEDALRLCSDDPRHPTLPDIYYGLCDVHRRLGNFVMAFDYGKQALQFYSECVDKALESRMRNLLGRVCHQMREFDDASAYYTRALDLAISVHSEEMIVANFVALADVRREEGLLDEAWRCCERALEYQEYVQNGQLRGIMYLFCGKVAEAMSAPATGNQRSPTLVQKAIAWYEKAEAVFSSIQARVLLAEVYGRLAQLLEITGQQIQAISYWKLAYTVYSRPDEA